MMIERIQLQCLTTEWGGSGERRVLRVCQGEKIQGLQGELGEEGISKYLDVRCDSCNFIASLLVAFTSFSSGVLRIIAL